MKQFLKEYMLFEDLSRMNNPEYFHEDFEPSDILELFRTIKTTKQYNFYIQTLRHFFGNLVRSQQFESFIMFKYLIVSHQIICEASVRQVVETFRNAFMKISIRNYEDHFQQYFSDHILKPYLHYLIKKCLLISRRMCSQQLKQKGENDDQDVQLWFIQFNLVNFSCQEFSSYGQFEGFFSSRFPFMMKFMNKVKQDSQYSYKTLKARNEINNFVEDSMLKQLEEKLLIILDDSEDYCHTLPNESGFNTARLNFFFETATKEDFCV